jgi:hypothetical protein
MSKRTNCLTPALKHGGYSGMTVLPGEDRVAFEKLHKSLIDEFAPNGLFEQDIIAELAHLIWRKRNLSTYHLAKEAKNQYWAIYSALSPPDWPTLMHQPETRSPEELRELREKADERARSELGQALELVEAGEVVTTEHLLDELSVVERLDSMIDRCIMRLLRVRGLKSLASPSSAASTQPRIGRAA